MLALRRSVPLKAMCSKRCEMPCGGGEHHARGAIVGPEERPQFGGTETSHALLRAQDRSADGLIGKGGLLQHLVGNLIGAAAGCGDLLQDVFPLELLLRITRLLQEVGQDIERAMRRAKNAFPLWQRRGPKRLLSGLVKCGVCGASYIIVTKDHVACSAYRNKRSFENKRTIRMEEIEQRVLTEIYSPRKL